MLSEIIKLCKRIGAWVKINEKELFLFAVIVLVAIISFGLGRLSKIREEKTPITITETTVNNSGQPYLAGRQAATLTRENNDKTFVASRNGKKYYYAWCDSAKTIKEQNRVWFSSAEEARKSGYQPAENCKGLK